MTPFRLAAVIALAFAVVALAVYAEDPKFGTMTAEALHQKLATKEKPLLVDVREQSEWDAGHIDGATLVPLGTVEGALKDVPKNREIAVICRSGRRSAIASGTLVERGFTNVTNVEGGMIAWEKLGYPVVKK